VEEFKNDFTGLQQNLPLRVEEDDYGVQTRKTHYAADEGCTFRYVGLTNKPPRKEMTGYDGGWIP
jgi:hypothetical protein